jgi:hypothetical protein
MGLSMEIHMQTFVSYSLYPPSLKTACPPILPHHHTHTHTHTPRTHTHTHSHTAVQFFRFYSHLAQHLSPVMMRGEGRMAHPAVSNAGLLVAGSSVGSAGGECPLRVWWWWCEA